MRDKHYMRNLRDMGPVRRLGLQLLREGATQSEVARELGVSRTAASNWAASLESVDAAALEQAAPVTSLSAAQLQALDCLLRGSARGHGFPSDGWTTARVAVLIESEFGLACSRVHAWRMLVAARQDAVRAA